MLENLSKKGSSHKTVEHEDRKMYFGLKNLLLARLMQITNLFHHVSSTNVIKCHFKVEICFQIELQLLSIPAQIETTINRFNSYLNTYREHSNSYHFMQNLASFLLEGIILRKSIAYSLVLEST